jgi:hypothetical protein
MIVFIEGMVRFCFNAIQLLSPQNFRNIYKQGNWMTEQALNVGCVPWRLGAVGIMIMLIMTIVQCGSPELRSHWRVKPIEINGNGTDWKDMMTQIQGTRMKVGLCNDSNYFYLSLVAEDISLQRQVMFGGLTVWFDNSGSEGKKFGVHFPLGIQMKEFSSNGPDQNQEQNSGDALSLERHGHPMQDATEAEIIGPVENEKHRINLNEFKRIMAKANTSSGSLVYELRIPLMDNKSDPYTIGTRAGEKVGIGFEIGPRPMAAPGAGEGGFPFNPGEGPPGGGGPPGAGNMGKDDKGLKISPAMKPNKPLMVWMKVLLAKQESLSH